MKRNNRFTKRFLALFLALCFVLGQMNLPAGLIKISPDFSFLHTKAAGTTFSTTLPVYNILEEKESTNPTATHVTFHFSVLDGTNVTLQGVDTNGIFSVGDSHLTIPPTVTYNSTTYTIKALGVPEGALEGSTDAFRGCTRLVAVDIPYTVEKIYAGTFGGDNSLLAVTITDTTSTPSRLKEIENSAFQGCFGSLAGTSLPDTTKNAANMIILPNTMTSIGENAFEGCSYLKKVIIGNTAKVALAKQAFANLVNLEEAAIPTTTVSMGEKCFYNCTRLATLTNGLPNNESFTEIPAAAFANCRALNLDVILSEYITAIGKECFSGCSTLSSADFSKSQITVIPEKAFYNSGIAGDLPFNNMLSSIEASAFENCTKICSGKDSEGNTVVWSLQFPSSLSKIGDMAFKSCTSIANIDWTDASGTACNITSLGKQAFASCGNLSNFVVPETTSLTEIPEGLLMNCGTIGRITIPTKITKIGSSAFSGCSNFSEFFYYEGSSETGVNDTGEGTGTMFNKCQLNSIGDNAFKGTNIKGFSIPLNVTAIQQSTFENCKQLDKVKLHNGITKIEQNAFFGCSQLGYSATGALTIPASVEIIGAAAFEGCSSLKGVSFAGDLETLPDNLFKDCTSMKSVVLPDSIVKLPANIFSGNTQLESVTMPGFNQITEIAVNSFLNCSNFKGFNADQTGEITFPSTLSALGASVFSGCSKLTKIDLGNTQVASIANKAFSDSGVTTIVFSKNLTNISADAFTNCTISDMTFQNVSKVATISATAFKNTDGSKRYLDSNIVLTVPDNLLADYKKVFNETLGFTFTDNQFKTSVVAAGNISLSITPTSLYIGQTAKATITQDGSEGASLYSSDESIIKVIDGSTIEAVALGTATVTARTASGLTSKAITVKVEPNAGAAAYVKDPITSITSTSNRLGTTSTNPSDYESALFVGDEMSIIVNTGLGNGNSSKPEDTLVWNLSEVDAAHPVTKSGNTVSNGYVSVTYGQRTGTTATATVKVLAYTTKAITATCSSSCAVLNFPINISPMYTNIVAKKADFAIDYSSTPVDARNQFFTFTPANSPERLQWNSSNPSVATIDENGKITCVAPGQTTISVSSVKSGLSSSVLLTVKNDITKITTADGKTSYEVIAGESFMISANTTFTNQGMSSPDSITWTSSDENTVSISVTPSGTNYNIAVTTLKAGSASIIGKNAAGQTKCTLSVRSSAVQFEKNSFSLYTAGPNKKGTIKFKSTLPSGAPVTYAMADSKSKKAASVSSSGVITGKKKGAAKVTVTVYGISYTVNVNVTQATLNVSVPGGTANKKKTQYKISKKTKKLTLGYSANYLGSTKKKVSFKSSKKSVATISKKGVIKLKKKGTTKITVTVNGVKKTFKLKVVK